jgi:general secretion pathway protein D
MSFVRYGRYLAAALLVLGLAGCSSYQSYRQAEIAASQGHWDEAVLHYLEAVEREPENLEYRAALLRTKIRASQEHFEKGKRYLDAEVWDRAMVEFQQAVQLDPTNQYAQAELVSLKQAIEAREQEREAPGTLEDLKAKTRGARPQPPELDPRSDEPIDLDFPEPTPVKDIYRALGKAFNINVLFDPNLKDQEISIVLKDVTAQSALEVIMRAAGHFYKVQDEHTIIVVADTPQNRRNYEDLVIQTFFLSNADIKQVMTMLRSLVDAKKIATNEQLNAIILRDTADKVKVAEKIIEANDKAKAEVVIDVELLQVNSSKMRNLGLSLDNYAVTQSLDLGGEDIPLRLSDIDDLTANNWSLTIPNFIYNFMKTDTDAQLLARPQLRISEGEQARLLIGERVPIPTTTFNTSNTVGGNIVPLTTFQYTDVGIRIEIEPRVHHNKEITLKVTVEVSNISSFVEAAAGQRQPVIGTRTIESTIRLKDGETNFLAGLIRTEDLDSQAGIPGLGDIPLLGRLFSNTNTDNTRTDVILTMTPHIIRTPNLTEEDLLPIWVGTESKITFRGGSPRVESDTDGPFETDSNRERVQEMLRRRLQQLPRGLRDDADQEQVQPEEPPGVDLAPSGGPGSFFDRNDDQQQDQDDEDQPNVSQLQPLAPRQQTPLMPMDGSAGGARIAQLGELTSTTAAAVAPGVSVELVTSAPRVAPGDEVVVQLLADAGQPVAHFPVELEFDPAVLAVERVEAGGFLGAAGEVTVLSDNSEEGALSLGASRLGRDRGGVEGRGVVATIHFRAVAAGHSAIAFRKAEALDSDLSDLAMQAAQPLTVVVAEGGAPGPQGPRDPRTQGSRDQGSDDSGQD